MAKSEWVTTATACEKLGFSAKHLLGLRASGLLKQGQHWRNIAKPHAARATYRWHLKRIEQALEVSAEVR